MKKFSFSDTWQALKDSFKGFSEHKLTKLSGSLAYFTIFSMGPLLIVLIFLCGLIFNQQDVQQSMNEQLQNFVGKEGAEQLQTIITNASIGDKGTIAAIIGIITLIIGATTVFAEIQDSINTIWGLKAKPKKGWLKMIKNRLLSFSVVVTLGFLLLVSLAVTTLIEGLSDKLQERFSDSAVVLFYILNLLITLIVVAVLFAVIFKVLPDAKLKWKDVIAGAVFTAILFMLGKFLISIYISKADIGSTYGGSGALVILIVWIYYSSLILYFGAEFTKAYNVRMGKKIEPSEYAVTVKEVAVEKGKENVKM